MTERERLIFSASQVKMVKRPSIMAHLVKPLDFTPTNFHITASTKLSRLQSEGLERDCYMLVKNVYFIHTKPSYLLHCAVQSHRSSL